MVCSFANAQNATFLNDFESVTLPIGWTTNGFSRITTQSCSGSASMASTAGQFAGGAIVSPAYFSDGQAIKVSVNYKLDFQGIIYVQYTTDDITWVNIVVTSTSVSTCTLLLGTIAENVVQAGTNVRFRISTYNPSILNVTYVIDDFQAVQSNGIISEYDFDNDLLNKTGSNPFSTNTQLTFVNGRDGSSNGAVNLNGGGTTATMPGLPYGNSARTVSLWVKINQISNSFNFLYHYGTSASGNGAYIKPLEALQFASNPSHSVSTNNVIDTWYHYVFIYDGTNSKIYKDGISLGDSPRTWSTINNSNIFKLGLTEDGGFNNFNGAIDDLKIYNIALTDAQVLNLFTNNSAFVVTAPIVSNVSSPNITPVAATINYSVNANNATTTTTIKYGLTNNNFTNDVAGLIASGNYLIPTSKVIPNLEPNTQYFYQIEVTNSAGTIQSAVLDFTTLPLPPAVAEYDFDNTYNNLNGTIPFSSASTSFVLGRDGVTENGAIRLNNSGSLATIPDLPYGSSPRTISFWSQNNFMFATNNTTFSYGTTGTSSGNSGSLVDTQIVYSANNNDVVVQTTTQQNVWYYFTYIYDGMNAKIYRDGVLLKSEPKTWNTINNNDIFRLGANTSNQGNYFGDFDDLKIFNYALSDTQINNLYTFNTLTIPTAILPIVSAVTSVPFTQTADITYTINANYSPTTTIIKYGTSSTNLDNQIAGFSTNGNSTTNTSTISGLMPVTQYFYQIEATNSVGTVTSTIENFTTVANLPSVAAYSFNSTLNNTNGNAPFGSNSSWSYVADRNATASSALRINGSGSSTTIAGLPTGNSPRTVSIWYKVSSNSNDNCLFVYGQSGGENAYGVSFNGSNTWYNFAWSTNTSFTNPSNDDTWHHLVTTFDASKTSKVYVDGVLKNTVVQNGWDTSVNNNTFWLGGLFSSTSSTFNGTVDDLIIYNFALTDDQVLNLFNSPTLSSQDFNLNNLEVSLYPNPTNGILNIDMTTEIQSIEIYNIQGQKVLHTTQKQINVSNLSTGMYLIKILDAQNRFSTKKFMKN